MCAVFKACGVLAWFFGHALGESPGEWHFTLAIGNPCGLSPGVRGRVSCPRQRVSIIFFNGIVFYGQFFMVKNFALIRRGRKIQFFPP